MLINFEILRLKNYKNRIKRLTFKKIDAKGCKNEQFWKKKTCWKQAVKNRPTCVKPKFSVLIFMITLLDFSNKVGVL